MTKEISVLILGDGNFSFTLSFCKLIKEKSIIPFTYLGLSPLTPLNNLKLISTSFDSHHELFKKYPETKSILLNLESFHGVDILHGINAWELKTHFPEKKFDFVIWNHPHLGTENFKLHRFLMAHFFHSVSFVLNKQSNPDHLIPKDPSLQNNELNTINESLIINPKVCISLVQGQDSRWDIVHQALKSCLENTQKLSFNSNEWPGYTSKRNKNGKSFQNTKTLIHMGNEMKSILLHFTWYKNDLDSLNNDMNRLIIQPTNDEETIIIPARRKIPESAQFECNECKRRFTTEFGLKRHAIDVHLLSRYGEDWNKKCHSCVKCVKVCSTAYDLLQHTISKHSEIDENDQINTAFRNINDNITVKDQDVKDPQNLNNINNIQDVKDPQTLNNIKGVNDSQSSINSYDYIPCDICGQAVTKKAWGYILHLETLKPIIGLDMECPICKDKFIEQRALFQHYLFCRVKDTVNFNQVQMETNVNR